MTTHDWQSVLAGLEIITRYETRIVPVSEEDLNAFEARRGAKLPDSYRTFCRVFGAGEIGDCFKVAVPGYRGKFDLYSLDKFGDFALGGNAYQRYSHNPRQHERAIFFSLDIQGNFHFLDPEDMTRAAGNECAVYSLFRDYEVQRTADSFASFVVDVCLGSEHTRLFVNEPRKTFLPMSK